MHLVQRVNELRLADPSKEQRKQALQLDLSTQSTGYVRASSAGASANLRGSKAITGICLF